MASRRAQNSTDESAYSVGAEIREYAGLARRTLSTDELELLAPELIIQRSLSVKSVISTSSSFARRYQQALNEPNPQVFVDIGKGMQGAVFEKVCPFP